MLLNCHVGEDSWESLGLQGDQTKLISKGNQYWIFIGRTDAEAEVPVLWPPDVKNRLVGKDPDAGKDWRQEEKGTTEYEIFGWHPWLDGHEFEQAPELVIDRGSLACSSPWGRKESDLTQQLNWTDAIKKNFFNLKVEKHCSRVAGTTISPGNLLAMQIYWISLILGIVLGHILWTNHV